MTLDLETLNATQRKAVEWDEGPLLVMAGPGSGKTRVLTFRIARLLASSPDDRFKILGITFTNKAAAEMRNRVVELVGGTTDRVLLTTFHSFAADVLRQHGSHLGLKPDFVILSQQADREAVLTDAIKAAAEDDEAPYTASRLLPAIDRMLDECIPCTAAEAVKVLGTIPNAKLIASIYEGYRARLIAANQMDFGSLLASAVGLLEENQTIAKQIRRVYRYICVDEFQDTNAAQFRLLVQLVPHDKPNLFIVADDDQIIYQWNGANPERLKEIRAKFKMTIIQLPENYRCPPEVIELANRLIVHNDDRASDKQALTARKPASKSSHVRLNAFADSADELAWVAEQISKLPVPERERSAVLGRTKKLLEQAVSALGVKGVPSYIAIRKTEFQSAPCRWLHAMLRLANSRQDREQLRRICKTYYQLEGVDLRVEDVVARASVASGDYLRAWVEIADERHGIGADAKKVLDSARKSLVERNDHWSFINDAFAWFTELKGSSATLPDGALDDFDEEQTTWLALQQEVIAQYGKDEITLHSFLQEFDLRSKEPPPPKHAIRCFTIHAAKGMEFSHVFLIGLAEEQLPSWAAVKKGDKSLEMREERRNCFVAITRAEETLTLTYAQKYFGYTKAPSRFLKEMRLI